MKEGGATVDRVSLPWKVRRLRESSFSIYVSNLPKKTSITEMKTMFYRAGKIVNVFLPGDSATGNTGLQKEEYWVKEVRGKESVCLSRMNNLAVLIQASSE